MIGFAVTSYKDNGLGGSFAIGIGTSMLQISNIFKNFWILLPPTLAAAVTGPVATVVLGMTNNAMGAGMGTSGLVGQIGTFTDMGFSADVAVKVAVIQFLLPAALSLIFDKILRRSGKIKDGDYRLEM